MNTSEPKKKPYNKPKVRFVKLVPEEAVLTACKTGTELFPCKEPGGGPLFEIGS